MSTQSEARVPGYMTPFSYPLQSINILSGTKDSVHVPMMKNMESLHYVNKAAPTHKNDEAAPKTHPCYGEIYPSFYAGPHAVSISAATASGYGFGRAHDAVNAPHLPFKATHGHLKHMDAHHPHEEVKHSKHHRHMHHDMASVEHKKEGMFLKKAMAEHKKEGHYM